MGRLRSKTSSDAVSLIHFNLFKLIDSLEHGITLKIPKAPVVNVGTPDKPVLVPPELCTVLPGQVARRALNPNQTTEMINVACRRPAENARLITTEGAQVIGMTQGNQNPLVRINHMLLAARD